MRSESGLYEVRAKDNSNDTIIQLGYFERAQITGFISCQLAFDDLRAQAVSCAIQTAIINDTVEYAPDGFNHDAARLSGQIQNTKSKLNFCGFSSRFISMSGMQPTQEMLDKEEQEGLSLQAQLTDLQKQWSDRFGFEYETFLENQQPLLLSS